MHAAITHHFLPIKIRADADAGVKKLPAQRTPPPAIISRAISGTADVQRIYVEDDVDDDSIAAFWDYQFLFVSQRAEAAEPVVLRAVEGAIPPDFPSGTYYLAGPGVFSDDYGSTVHPLDGHGYLRAFSIGGPSGEVKYTARYVATEAKEEEWDGEVGRWRFTHRGPFSVLRGGKKVGNTKVMKNVANTCVLRWGAHLLCLWEGGVPYKIEPRTLDTVGLFDVIGGEEEEGKEEERKGAGRALVDVAAGFLKPILHGVFKMPPKRLLSHYKIDARRNRLLLISCNAEDMLLPLSNFTFYEFDLNFKLLQKKEFSIPDHLMIHDWAFTDSHYIIFGNRIKLDVPGSMLAVSGLSPMISALSVNPSRPTSPIYLLPRFSEEGSSHLDKWRVPIEVPSQLWLSHVANSFEQKDDKGNLGIQIYAAACSYQWFNFQKMFGKRNIFGFAGYDWKTGKLDPSYMNAREGEESTLPHLVRVSVELNAKGDCQKCRVEPLYQWKRPSDFPAINPAFSGSRNSYIYTATSSGSRQFLPHFPFDSVAKINIVDGSVSSWSSRSRRFIGEPVFVPKGDEEDDGYLLVVEYAVSVQRCYLVILDSKRIGKANAVVAKLEVPKHLNFPLGFHGFWAPE
ncbi:carotenoid cleavage dioxygenase 7, chloroplastic [Cinnamomum micranthum f. kanehirae]|uniref:Carotenoid cleavage dioxygenase 7, chloroplastic n=1 Tax=Cinnamomum micranthum f. kanehirae TaxID=337451 RepID=A0A443PG96_9MAGN|nr:carotenoid cleavage dioxygenase 7, chloroplastic [Cinnamomum micranthum f. kanehirae]